MAGSGGGKARTWQPHLLGLEEGGNRETEPPAHLRLLGHRVALASHRRGHGVVQPPALADATITLFQEATMEVVRARMAGQYPFPLSAASTF